jgi:hypothetical protein
VIEIRTASNLYFEIEKENWNGSIFSLGAVINEYCALYNFTFIQFQDYKGELHIVFRTV